jgi:hypothetical protein
MSPSDKTVDAYIASLPAAQKEVAARVRKLLREAAPGATESIKWAQPVYEDHGPFAYIKAYPTYVNLGFWRAVEIDAGRGLLETSGSQMAHVKPRSTKDVDPRLVKAWVAKAVELNRAKGDPTKKR